MPLKKNKKKKKGRIIQVCKTCNSKVTSEDLVLEELPQTSDESLSLEI